MPVASTSKAAEMAREEPGVGGHRQHAGGRAVRAEDRLPEHRGQRHNVTRFFVIGRKPAQPTGDDKTSVCFTTKDEPGALVNVLAAFRQSGVNMSFIESRPSKKRNWEYYFFADLKGHQDSAELQSAMAEARKHCLRLNVLGSYPRAQEVI